MVKYFAALKIVPGKSWTYQMPIIEIAEYEDAVKTRHRITKIWEIDLKLDENKLWVMGGNNGWVYFKEVYKIWEEEWPQDII